VVDEKYQHVKHISHGAYGIVCSALNKQTKQKVAIKKVKDAFDDLVDAKRILREIKLLSKNDLKEFFNHENIIKIVDL
jgi:mitogen-activated protein kinase 1/3